MRVVAFSATHHYRRMDVLLCEYSLVMAIVTESGLFRDKQLGVVRRMRVVALGAAHSDGGMDILLGKHFLIMAIVAEVRQLGHQPPISDIRSFMRHGDNPGVAKAAACTVPSGHMDKLAFYHSLMAPDADRILGRSSK
jgi:hypothetical protein